MNYRIENLWKINGSFVAAKTIEDAIKIYSKYLENSDLLVSADDRHVLIGE